jgi:hypothetical protein
MARPCCTRCGAELEATGRLAELAHAEGLCSDCWLDVPTPANERMPACSRCLHSAASHMHGNPLSCAHCALSPLAHAHGIGCSTYTPRTAPHYGASCTVPGCECFGGYCPRDEGA